MTFFFPFIRTLYPGSGEAIRSRRSPNGQLSCSSLTALHHHYHVVASEIQRSFTKLFLPEHSEVMVAFFDIRNFSVFAIVLLCFTCLSECKNPVQFCRRQRKLGIDSCVAFFTLLNVSSSGADFYITIETNRYDSGARGWTAFGLGDQMKGALMFITYGDPADGGLTTSVRTANGHHPPSTDLALSSSDQPIPDIRIWDHQFGPYIGDAEGDDRPSHTDRKHIVCYGCDHWAGTNISGRSESQPWVWAVNRDQDFGGDFAEDARIDMHVMGGVGWFWADVPQSRMFAPLFGRINHLYQKFHTTEIGPTENKPQLPPDPEPSAAEDVTDPEINYDDSPSSMPTDSPAVLPPIPPTPPASDHAEPPPDSDNLEQPAKTSRGKSIRDWMWHLHGLLMTAAFLVLYPMGAILIRSGDSRAFNFHWTTQAFGSVVVVLGAIIGVIQSSRISVTHQYLGFAIMASITMQILLGWRQHVRWLGTKTKSWLSTGHVWLGRAVLAAGYVNLVLGMILRRYGRATMLGLVVAIVGEVALLLFMMGRLKRVQKEEGNRPGRSGNPELDEAEEYFQLVGEDDEDGWSEDEQHAGDALAKKEQAKKLAKLDAV
jgi:hypothetical protein